MTLARATRTDKNDAADRSGRKANSKTEPKETATPVDRDAVDGSLSRPANESNAIDNNAIDAAIVEPSSNASSDAEASISDATDASGEAQDSPGHAHHSAQEATSSEPGSADTRLKSAVAGGLPGDQIGAATKVLTNAAAGDVVDSNAANLPSPQPDSRRTPSTQLLPQVNPQATAANEESSQRTPASSDAVAAREPAGATAASVVAAITQRDHSKATAPESASKSGQLSNASSLGATPQRVQPLQAQASVNQTRQQNQSGNKVKPSIELKAVVTESQPASAAAPASARAAQVEAALRLENALAMMANSSEGNATSRIGTDHAAQMVAGPKLADSTASGPSLAQQFQSWSSPEDQEFSGQMTRGLAAMMNQRGGVMTMRLNPPELGEVRVQMTLSRGVVSAEFQASTAQAHALLDRNLTALRNALEGQGLTVDRLSVHAAPAPGTAGQSMLRDENSGSWNQQGNSAHHRGEHDAANGESRGRHEQPHDGQQRWNREADFNDFFNDLETQFVTVNQSP